MPAHYPVSSAHQPPKNERSILAKPDHLDDGALWTMVRSGNEACFRVLYARYVNRLFNYGMHRCADEACVKDCLTVLFRSVWSERASLCDSMSLHCHLFRTLRRLIAKRPIPDLPLRKVNTPMTGGPDAIAPFDLKTVEQKNKINTAAIHELSPAHYEATFLKFSNAMRYDEISFIMELPQEVVFRLISKSLDSCQEAYPSIRSSSM